MTPVYALFLVAGFIGLLVWVAMTAVGDTVEGWSRVDPEVRFGVKGRFVVAGTLGFGLAGMSATFAGWSGVVAFVGAVGGALLSAGVAARYGPDPTTGSN